MRAAHGALAAVLGTTALAAGAVAALRRPAREPRTIIASRLYAPEPAAAAIRLRALAKALAERGPVTVLTSTPPGMAVPHDAGVEVRSAPALRDANGYIRGYAQYLSFDIPLAARLLAGPRPEAVIAEPPPTTGAVVALASALRGVPYTYYAADVWSDAADGAGAPGWVVAALRAVEGRVLARAAHVLAVSDGVADRVRELGAREVTVVPNGIDTEVFTIDGPVAPEARPEGSAEGAPYLLYAGTASEWQGAGIFVDALRLVHETEPDARLVFLGQGSDWDEIARRADGDPRVEMRGLVPPEEAAAWQRGAAGAVVSIRPGAGYDFAYPTKIFAALACGTPVVYAGPGPARDELPAAGLGWAADYEARAVADAMLAALADARSPQRAERAQERRAWVLEHRSMAAAMERAADAVLVPQA